MTINEVSQFLKTVEPSWRDYFLIRFWTGLRSCEIHGLQWQHIDFEHRLIRICQNWVNGEACDVKTPKSRRTLKLCDTLLNAFKRIQTAAQDNIGDHHYIFTDANGIPLDTHFVSKKLWYPTLKKAGLKRRRAYETRHTAAVLHISAHENPLYVSQMLGHSDTRLLFEIYAPYVANASRIDGSAFDALMQNKGIV
ncbi:site-specific integrase [Parashewanella spongiae]|uniref:Site-specific integrase n=2 Tax=Parashewanella spongiae TaxID=342950 RepID=A0A3A6TAK9_9GAMM|nr:site-specific integrase [Parashewanella spongiae]